MYSYFKFILSAIVIIVGTFLLSSCSVMRPAELSLTDRLSKMRLSSYQGRLSKYDKIDMQVENLLFKVLFEKLEDELSGSDTLIVFSAYNIQNGVSYGTLWTPQKTFSYWWSPGIPADSVEITADKSLYTDFIIHNVKARNWEIIDNRQKEQPALGVNLVRVYLINRIGNEERIEYFEFEEFFDALTSTI